MSKDRALRESAFHSFYKSYQQHINTFAATYAGQVKAATASLAVRHFESSRASAMAGEHIPVEVYDNLIKAVRKFMPSMYRYVSLRKKMLGLDELHYYDLYAPLSMVCRRNTAMKRRVKKSLPLWSLWDRSIREL